MSQREGRDRAAQPPGGPAVKLPVMWGYLAHAVKSALAGWQITSIVNMMRALSGESQKPVKNPHEDAAAALRGASFRYTAVFLPLSKRGTLGHHLQPESPEVSEWRVMPAGAATLVRWRQPVNLVRGRYAVIVRVGDCMWVQLFRLADPA